MDPLSSSHNHTHLQSHPHKHSQSARDDAPVEELVQSIPPAPPRPRPLPLTDVFRTMYNPSGVDTFDQLECGSANDQGDDGPLENVSLDDDEPVQQLPPPWDFGSGAVGRGNVHATSSPDFTKQGQREAAVQVFRYSRSNEECIIAECIKKSSENV